MVSARCETPCHCAGRYTFQRNEFDAPANVLRNYDIKSITVFYRLGIQQTLEKLLTLLPSATVMRTIVDL